MSVWRAVLLLWCCVAPTMPAWAIPQQLGDPVESGREALEAGGRLPWYDVEDDQLRRIDVEPQGDDPKRLSDWSAKDRPRTLRGSSGQWTIFWEILRALAWIALALLVAAIIWALVWAASRVEKSSESQERVRELGAGKGRIEELPVEVSPQITDLLAAARAFRDAGEFGKAVIYAFAHQLVELDKHHLIQLTKGKTNRQYLGELGAHPHFIELLTPMMFAFEDVFFGHHELSPQRFQACWDSMDRFHEQLEQVAL